MADTLLVASGSDTVASGIVSPGTYFMYLNQEFTRAGGKVVRRQVYMPKQTREQEKDPPKTKQA